MIAHGSRIILYSAAARFDEDLLCKQLADIGYPDFTSFNANEPVPVTSITAGVAAIVVLMTDANITQRPLLSLIQGIRSIPVFGLFSKSCAQSCNSLIEACDEVAVWPCSNQELDFRIGKILCQGSANGSLGQSLFVKMNILGNSPEFLQVLDKVCKITKCDAPVYIDGETGTGKDLIARAIHYLSARRDYPFIATNCGAIPDQLVENEFFGHDKGAYTDARESSDGIIAQAEGGTLFLDEIETLSAKGQVVLLRFLENMMYRPLGSKSVKTADLRVITATNESIGHLVEEGSFRKDLFYRVNIINIQLPPLRQRRGDIALLAEHFIRQYQAQYKQPEKELHPESLESLRYYDWPGNVRELENMLHREFLLAEGNSISINEIESVKRERRDSRGDRRMQNLFSLPMVKAKSSLINEFEQCYLSAVLDKAEGNVSEAARLAGKERRSFTRLMEKYSLDRSHYKIQ